jgi:hypothetical protein
VGGTNGGGELGVSTAGEPMPREEPNIAENSLASIDDSTLGAGKGNAGFGPGAGGALLEEGSAGPGKLGGPPGPLAR